MKRERLSDIEKRSQKRRNSLKKRALSLLMAAIITAGSGYSALRSTASVEAAVICGQTEHVHTAECYSEQKDVICGTEEFAAHTHTAECYTEKTDLICEQEERTGHTHNESCREKQLICQTPESAGHAHGDSCRTTKTSIICGLEESAEHIHADNCMTAETNVTCGQEESAGHAHGEGCYQNVQICGQEENTGHTHGEDCYRKEQVLSCGQEETAGHAHGDTCYQITKILSCTVAEHVHGENCYPAETEKEPEQVTEKETELVTEQVTEKETELVTEQATEKETEQITEKTTEKETEAIRDGDPVFLGEYIKAVTVERKVEGTSDSWEKLAVDIKNRTTSPVEVKISDVLCFKLEYEIPGKVLEGTESTEYKLPMKSSEAKNSDKKETAYAADEKTEIGKTVTKTDGTVKITFAEQYLEKNDSGKEIKGLYQFKAYASDLNFDETGAAELRFEKEENYQKSREQLEVIEIVFHKEEAQTETESESEAASEGETESESEPVSEGETESESEPVSEGETESESEAASEGETESESELESERETESELTGEEQNLSAVTTGASVTAAFEENVIPEGAVLQVVELPADGEGMAAANELISAVLAEQGRFVSASYAYDIEFVNEANETVAPEGQVTVEVLFNTPVVLTDAENIWNLYHITDDGTVEDLTAAETTVIAADETGAVTGFKFTSGAFSPYVLVETAEGLSAEQLQANYENYLAEVESWKSVKINDDNWQKADALLAQIMESYENGELTEEAYGELYGMLHGMLVAYYNTVAEPAVGTVWMALQNSGWFQEYSAYAGMTDADKEVPGAIPAARTARRAVMRSAGMTSSSSAQQVVSSGGSESSDDNAVKISKTIAGTSLENVFDITLKVETTESIQELYEDPDMAVVIVMDISNTMRSAFGNTTRYKAAMTAAEQFLDKFAASANGVSKVGYVAFNTDAHQIFGLSSCSNDTEAAALKNTMRTKTGDIINATGYADSHSRFTNIEAGLQRGWDMLKNATNQNKYIIFLSDGFPTTYISQGYKGYDTYDDDGDVFYDHVLKAACKYGTSYSNTAAIRAREKATAIKNEGIKIFSIGVDVGSQTIEYYHNSSVNKVAGTDRHSIVERTNTNYEIGDATDASAYQNWLGNKIGSGYYYDSTNSSGLSSAYDQIFAQIKNLIEEKAEAQWVANDPMPVGSDATRMVEFIGFYTKTPELTAGNLSGAYGSGEENTAAFDSGKEEINWDLKKSGYQASTVNGETVYTYQLVYRVRLKNESNTFAEGTVYDTNNPTKLTYQKRTDTNGTTVISDPETLNFPIPSVKGYLVDLEFTKLDSYERPVVGAEFTLSHDTEQCSRCRGDETSTPVADMVATSGTDGKVTFTDVPSGHIYKLEETHMPNGYYSVGNNYQVTAAYDEVTVTATDKDGSDLGWNGIITNNTQYRLPNTGGSGTTLYTVGGLMTALAAGYLLLYNNKKRGKEAKASS